jgi:hypothetical protein
MVGILRAHTAFGIDATAVATTCGRAAVGATRGDWRALSCGFVAAMFGLETKAAAHDAVTNTAAILREDAISCSACWT